MILTENEITKLKQLEPGLRTNKVLYHLLAPHVLGYWLYSEPGHQGQELSDLIMIWEDVVFLFEAKTRNKVERTDINWTKSKLSEAIRQINNSADMLRQGRVKEIRNIYSGVTAWDAIASREIRGIVIMNHDSDPYDPRVVAEDAFRQSSIPIQVFSLFDFAELLRFVNTPGDLLVYYELRHQYGGQYSLNVHQELETYAGIMSCCDDLLSQDASIDKKNAEGYKDKLFSVTNAILRTADAGEEDYHRLAASLLIDLVLLHYSDVRADKDATGKRVGSPQHDHYVNAIKSIAAITRNRRIFYGDVWVQYANKALDDRGNHFVKGYSASRNACYVLGALVERNEHSQSLLIENGREAMRENQADVCVCIGEKADAIIATYNALMDIVKGADDLDVADNFNPIICFVDKP